MSDWNQFIAALVDVMGFGLLALAVLVLAALVALLWYTWPAWSPTRWRLRRRHGGRWRWRWPRWHWPRLRRRRRRKKRDRATTEVTEADLDNLAASPEELPDVAPAVFASLADRLAAEGRYAEAVRERLRSMVRELVDHQVVAPRPGWTVTELARAAGAARPVVGPPLNDATQVFSTIWYGDRSARPEDDAMMRSYAGRLHELVGGEQ
jgi:hypothetical protein